MQGDRLLAAAPEAGQDEHKAVADYIAAVRSYDQRALAHLYDATAGSLDWRYELCGPGRLRKR